MPRKWGLTIKFAVVVGFQSILSAFNLFSKIKFVLVFFNMGSNCLKMRDSCAHFTLPCLYLAEEKLVDRLNIPSLMISARSEFKIDQ
jgi:hypothetical protein